MISNEDIEYIKYVYEKKDSAIKPNVRRIVRAYNEVFKDRLKRPLSENLCACNLRPYLIQLYRKIQTFISPQDNIIENEKVEDEKTDEKETVETGQTVDEKPKKETKNVKSNKQTKTRKRTTAVVQTNN